MRLLIVVLLLISSIKSFTQKDYKIQINDTTLEVDLNNEYMIISDGKEINFRIFTKDTLTYDDKAFSFDHPKEFKVSKMQLDQGIDQIMLMTAEGSGFLIQKYVSINPTMLNEMMMSEVTKESLNYGFEMKRRDYKRSLKSGQEVDVDKAILTYKQETNIYEIASIGKKDEGILIMTVIMDERMSEQGRKIIDMMWNTLKYK